MKITNSQLKRFYFPTKRIENLAKKYFPELINFYGKNNLFENKNLLPDERIRIEEELNRRFIELLRNDKDMLSNFAFTYMIGNEMVLAEIVLQSVMAYSKLFDEKYKDFDIFLDTNSVLYFEGSYPSTVQWLEKQKKVTILDFTEMMREMINALNHLDLNMFRKWTK